MMHNTDARSYSPYQDSQAARAPFAALVKPVLFIGRAVVSVFADLGVAIKSSFSPTPW